jgi:hypothetical protein
VTAALCAALILGIAPANAAGTATAGRWAITTRGDDPTHVQLRLEYSDSSESGWSNSSHSSDVPVAEAGLPPDRLRGAIAPVNFQIQREPGTFSCTGSAGEGSGAGRFTYAPSARFDDALSGRGLGRPTYRQSLELAMVGATLAFVDQLRAAGAHATLAELLRVMQHGVTPKYVADLASLGYRVGSLDQLVRLRDHGVSIEFIRAVQAAGYAQVTAEQLVTLRDHGVTPRYIGELARAGYKNLSADDLIALRDHGVSVAFVDRLRAHGYANLSIRDLIRLRDAGI